MAPERVKEEPEWSGVSAAAARAGLYDEHEVKHELVLGPERLQPQDIAREQPVIRIITDEPGPSCTRREKTKRMREPVFQSPNKKRRKQALNTSEKHTILNIHKEVTENWPQGSYPYSSAIIKKTAETGGVSRATVYKILKEYSETRDVKSPPPRKRKSSKFDGLDDITLSGIRRKIHNFFSKNEIPTLDKVLTEVNTDDTLPNFSRTGLYRVLKNKLKFKYAGQSRKSKIIDKNEIVVGRVKYLKEIKRMRNEGKKIYYTDETWLNEGPTRQFAWQDTTIESIKEAHKEGLSSGLKVLSGKGKRLIIAHIGSTEGFLAGGELIFETEKTEGDYHSEKDAHNFEKWFSEIFTKVESGSVIVLDNASYHFRNLERVPTTSTRKADIQNWLQQNNISFDTSEVRAQLLRKVNSHKHEYQAHFIDEMAKAKGVTVLRLPPYHCQLNPITLIWAQVKGYVASVASKNKSLKLSEIKSLIPEALASITAERWQTCIKHVEEEEKKMSQLDGIVDDMLEQFINVGASSSEETEDTDEDIASIKDEVIIIKQEPPQWSLMEDHSDGAEEVRAGLYNEYEVKHEPVLEPEEITITIAVTPNRTNKDTVKQEPVQSSGTMYTEPVDIHVCDNFHSCEICNNQLSSNFHLITHKTIHQGKKPFGCEICKKQFKWNSSLLVHMRIHTREKPFSCQICKKQFRSSSNLVNHKRIHTGEKPFTCDICKKQFTKKSSLLTHMRTHTGERPFTCDICKKHFINNSNLLQHIRVHTGERPFTCEICMKKFRNNGHLGDHMRIHSGEKPFTCEICKTQFRHRGRLRKHKCTPNC